MGYPVIETGLVMAPRGVGTMLSMIVVGRLVGLFDLRVLIFFGLGLTSVSLYMMSGFNLQMNANPIMITGVMQGFGLGFVFVPLSTLAFATISTDLRGDATSMFSLVRNVGSGVGISLVTTVLARMNSVNHVDLAASLTAAAPQVRMQFPQLLAGDPLSVTMIDGLVAQQAAMISYLDNFLLLLILTVAVFPIALFLRSPKTPIKGSHDAAVME